LQGEPPIDEGVEEKIRVCVNLQSQKTARGKRLRLRASRRQARRKELKGERKSK